MNYNVGDLVVRYCFDGYLWNMLGIITAKRPKPQNESETYYTIHWLDPKIRTPSADTWQVNEFELVETAKKV